jgi:hypothetical protein
VLIVRKDTAEQIEELCDECPALNASQLMLLLSNSTDLEGKKTDPKIIEVGATTIPNCSFLKLHCYSSVAIW